MTCPKKVDIIGCDCPSGYRKEVDAQRKLHVCAGALGMAKLRRVSSGFHLGVPWVLHAAHSTPKKTPGSFRMLKARTRGDPCRLWAHRKNKNHQNAPFGQHSGKMSSRIEIYV